MNTPPDHQWALTRLTRYATGTLPEQETLELQAHLDHCTDCQARLAPVRDLGPADAAHLPASLVATWDRSAKRLSPVERDLVGKHLSTCSACRETLEFAGHEAVLPVLVAEPERRARITKLSWVRSWAYGVSAVAAAAAAWLLVVQPALTPRDSRTAATIGGATRSEITVTFELLAASPDGLAGALPLPSPDLARTTPVEVGARALADGVLLALPVSLLPAGDADSSRKAGLTLLDHGRTLGTLETPASRLGTALRLRSLGLLTPGEYELRISVDGTDAASAPMVASYSLRIR